MSISTAVRGEKTDHESLSDLLSIYSWGQSAGAISVGLQMVTNGGNAEGLFQGAFMQVSHILFYCGRTQQELT